MYLQKLGSNFWSNNIKTILVNITIVQTTCVSDRMPIAERSPRHKDNREEDS